MSEWKVYKLEDIVSFSQGFQISTDQQYEVKEKDMDRFIRIVDYTNKNEKPRYIKKIDKRYWAYKDDVVMIRYGSNTAGKVVRGLSGYIANNMFKVNIIDNNILDKEFLYYFLSQERIYKYLMSSQSSSTMPAIKFSDLYKIDAYLPTIEQQRKVVTFLNYINDKIQLNTQINQTLEAIAQAIFKSWFVDFDPVRAKAAAILDGKTRDEANLSAMAVISGKAIEELTQTEYQQLWEIADAFPSEFGDDGLPMGWKYRYLKDVCNIVYGKGLPKNKLTENGYYVFGANGVIGYYSEYMYEKSQILIGCRGTVGRVTISHPFSFITNNSLIIECEKSELSLYYIEKYLRGINLKEVSSGSVQPQITIQSMNNVKILIPNKEIHTAFAKKVEGVYKLRQERFYENIHLSKIRDLLLPKLLSGEIEL